jgi:HD superfamily phosphohydrolase
VKRTGPIQEKLYRDPVHDIIAIDASHARGRALCRLIDTPEMQRLRRVRQLGLAYFAYQGAEHSRFAHAMGATHLMERALRQLQKGYEISEEEVFFGQCAALLHDVGHGPFSHVFERFTEKHHEEWTRDILLSQDSEVFSVLSEIDIELPHILVRILHEGTFKPGILTDLISSQLDVDRLDYLLRDNLMTGVKHGVFDLDRLLHVLRVNTTKDRIVVAAKGLHPVEKYLQARYHMYRQVYQHKTVVVAEAMLTALLQRAADLVDGRADGGALPAAMGDAQLPRPLLRLLSTKGNGMSVPEYLRLTEPMMYFGIEEMRLANDPVLRDLSRRLLGRQLFKAVEANAADVIDEGAKGKRARKGRQMQFLPNATDCVLEAREYIRKRGLPDEYYFLVIVSKDTPYKPYDPRGAHSKHIEIETSGGGYQDVSEASEIVRALQDSSYNLVRFVFPETDPQGRDLRGPMKEILAPAVAARE